MASPSMMGARVFSALERARERRGLSQQQVADVIGMDRGNFARMEGGTHMPGSARLFQWAAAVGVELCVVDDTKEATE